MNLRFRIWMCYLYPNIVSSTLSQAQPRAAATRPNDGCARSEHELSREHGATLGVDRSLRL